ncbi:MAG TPA: LysR family transcriptional regulator, partial [Symbiobacteriaceae bacterium]|nr:LysR family transcriptional regulator [Symbiobacteriaceae bacterium]
FTKAANQLHMSQQAISLQVRRFEKDLSIPLVVRAGRRIELSREGLELYERGRAILAKVHDLQLWLDEARTGHQSRISVLCSSTPGSYILPAVIPEFRTLHPHVEVDLRVSATIDMATHLSALESVDLTFYIEEFNDPGFIANPLSHDDLWLVCHPDHPLARRPSPITLADLGECTFVLRGPKCNVAQRVLAITEENHQVPSVQFVGSMEGCKTAVLSGLGVTYMSGFAVEDLVRARRMSRLVVPQFQHSRVLYWGKRPGHNLSGPARELLDLVCRRLGSRLLSAANG